jgi:hypothetical protein
VTHQERIAGLTRLRDGYAQRIREGSADGYWDHLQVTVDLLNDTITARRCAEARLTAVELEHTDPPESSLHSHNPKFRCPQCDSGTQATPEHSDATRRSAAQKPSSSPSLTPVDQQTWQPIETAPKDGTTVMLFYPKQNPAGIAEMGHYRRGIKTRRDEHEGWRYLRSHSALYDLEHQPTHWMPLPPPPLPAVDQQRPAQEVTAWIKP